MTTRLTSLGFVIFVRRFSQVSRSTTSWPQRLARDGSRSLKSATSSGRLRPRRQHPARKFKGAQAGGAADVCHRWAGDGAAWLVELAGTAPHYGARNADRTPRHDGVGRRQRAGTPRACAAARTTAMWQTPLPPAGWRSSRPGTGQSRTASRELMGDDLIVVSW